VSQIVQEQEGIIALISVVYWLTKEQTATPSLAQLLEQRGVKVSAVHRTPQAAASFTRCLTRVVRKWRLNEIRRAGYFSLLMIDEGTDTG
jgi:hypothetical protein